MKDYSIILYIVILLIFSSCATIFGGKRNTIRVQGIPDKSLVFLDGEHIGDTPLHIRVSKYKIQEGSTIEVKKAGYETLVYEVIRRPHVGYVLLNVAAGSIPLIVDVANGNIYRPNTRKIHYDLVPIGISLENEKEFSIKSK